MGDGKPFPLNLSVITKLFFRGISLPCSSQVPWNMPEQKINSVSSTYNVDVIMVLLYLIYPKTWVSKSYLLLRHFPRTFSSLWFQNLGMSGNVLIIAVSD